MVSMAWTTSSRLLLYCGFRDKAYARRFIPPGIYFSVKLNQLKYCAHQTCFGESFCRVLRASRFLWYVHTPNGTWLHSGKWCHVELHMLPSPILPTSFQSLLVFWRCRSRVEDCPLHSFGGELASTWTINGRSGSRCLRIASFSNSLLSVSNGFWHFRVHWNGWPGHYLAPPLWFLIAR